ncbi:amphi-Trp domain-containing protein [Paenibacillus aestuarii]|uniref:Amphi-Trp domain-containing protein n=1 Tax=Paenibacillus aestuarii TaxID=516965 RepID=A0ABW0KC45_9BACL|nr:amphi-Trp domain-containing protein [Paenibacillus aestuarii]
MRIEEEFVGNRQQFAELLRRTAEQLEDDQLHIRGRQVQLPDAGMEYKISHKTDGGKNKLTLSIEWLDSEED